MGNQQQQQLFDFGKQEQLQQQDEEEKDDDIIIMKRVQIRRDLGDGSSVVYYPCFISQKKSWDFFHFLNHHIPWSTPTIHVFGKPFLQVLTIFLLVSFFFSFHLHYYYLLLLVYFKKKKSTHPPSLSVYIYIYMFSLEILAMLLLKDWRNLVIVAISHMPTIGTIFHLSNRSFTR